MALCGRVRKKLKFRIQDLPLLAVTPVVDAFRFDQSDVLEHQLDNIVAVFGAQRRQLDAHHKGGAVGVGDAKPCAQAFGPTALT